LEAIVEKRGVSIAHRATAVDGRTTAQRLG
jgi:hypothetical protein